MMGTRPPTVLLVHNSYQHAGGEDAASRKEKRLLESAGHRVVVYERHNNEITTYSSLEKITLPVRAAWSAGSARAIRAILRRDRPDVVHFHNTFPLISPAAYYAAKAEGLPVVQTLHNYRLLCANALFLRDGHACEMCVSHTLGWPGVWHACYRSSRAASGVVVGMVTAHKLMGSWNRKVDVYIALTEFAKAKFAQNMLSEDRIVVKPNFVDPDPGFGEHTGRYALFVGRLSPEKGVHVLLEAWRRMAGCVPLRIVGNGPLESEVARRAAETPGIDCLGYLPSTEVSTLMRGASLLVVPSVWYEGFPLVIVEALATGLPVIVSGHGAMAEIVDAGRTGLHYRPGDPDDLVAKVEWAWTHPREMTEMGREARREFEQKYTAGRWGKSTTWLSPRLGADRICQRTTSISYDPVSEVHSAPTSRQVPAATRGAVVGPYAGGVAGASVSGPARSADGPWPGARIEPVYPGCGRPHRLGRAHSKPLRAGRPGVPAEGSRRNNPPAAGEAAGAAAVWGHEGRRRPGRGPCVGGKRGPGHNRCGRARAVRSDFGHEGGC